MPRSCGLRRAAQTNRGGTATIFGSRQRIWGDVADRVARLAGALLLSGSGKILKTALREPYWRNQNKAVN